MSGLYIRHYVEGSSVPMREIAAVIPRCFNHEPWYESWSNKSAQLFLTKLLAKRFDVFALVHGKETHGFGIGLPLEDYEGSQPLIGIGASSASYYLQGLAVEPDYRSRGICQEFCELLIVAGGARGYRDIWVRTRFDNDVAIRIFRRVGFEEVGITEATTGGKLSRRVVFRLAL